MISKSMLEKQISVGFGAKIRTPEARKRARLLKTVHERKRMRSDAKRSVVVESVNTASAIPA